MSDNWRGHNILLINDNWVYEDTKEPTEFNERPCGYCDKENTSEGHDGCLGELNGVMNACCGHGRKNEAYVQFPDGSIVKGSAAIHLFEHLKR